MRIALYLRVSTDRRETENQAIQLRDFAAKQGWEIVHEYCDEESGSKADRAEFKQCSPTGPIANSICCYSGRLTAFA